MTDSIRRFRILVLPFAAVLISGLVWLGYYNQRMLERNPQASGPRVVKRSAPPMELLYDQKSQVVKFERYLGRTKMVVVFFDGEAGADRDPWLTQLRDHHDQLEAAKIQVIGIGMTTPYANREAEKRSKDFPFPLLSDIGKDIPAPAHTQWGRFDRSDGTFLTGVFLVDRSGMVEMQAGKFKPVSDPQSVVTALCQGHWPE